MSAVPASPPPLLVVAGPTASGKSRLGVEVAEAIEGEIVSADAFAVYRGLDIGTDTPDPSTRRRVAHHLIDVAAPTERLSAGAFADLARPVINDIRRRGATPIVVGGTHFWIRALLVGLFPDPVSDPQRRRELRDEWRRDPTRTYERLVRLDPESAVRIGPADGQRIQRALEVVERTGTPLSEHWRRHPKTPRYRALIVVPERSREELDARIEARVERMFAAGLEEEVRRLLQSGVPTEAHALKAIGYREIVASIEGRMTLAEAADRIKTSSRQLARRQLTWLRSMSEGAVHWVPPAESGGAEAVIALWRRHSNEGGAR